jgi:3',5'-cyclic-AMP phosphodiesterase
MHVNPTRREVVRTGIAACGLAALNGIAVAQPRAGSGKGERIRFAHLTDMHVQPELRAGEGFAAALQSLNKLDPRPDFIITGGDHVMDVFETDAARADVQWNLYTRVLRENTKLPTYACMGNHDVFGWGAAPDKVPADSRGYGKASAVERLNMKGPYYSFDEGPWHFVCLDNIARRDRGYLGDLEEAQSRWLATDLERAGGRPVCVVSHIPLLGACVFFDGGDDRVREDFWHVPDSYMHRNVKPLLDLLRRHNVRLLLSGHMHLVDRVDYLGMTFICDGAVCGGWWKGPNQEFSEGYGVVDLWSDGTFEHKYVTYGWKAEPE